VGLLDDSSTLTLLEVCPFGFRLRDLGASFEQKKSAGHQQVCTLGVAGPGPLHGDDHKIGSHA
jgi:hypothetical protein